MNYQLRNVRERGISLVCLAAAVISGAILVFIIGYLFIGAIPALNIPFIFGEEMSTGTMNGAIGNAVAGTILISLLATLIAAPFGVGTAIYLARYAKKNRFTDTFRFLIEVLSGTPSIVIGIFGFLLFVVYLKKVTGGFSLIAGSLGLAILILPVIARAAEEAINTVSRELEEGSYALGADKWDTTWRITIPTAFAGIITGIILGFGRAAEESAVVLFTTGYSQFMPQFALKANDKIFGGIKIYPLQDLVGTLPLSVYNSYEHANIVPQANGYAAAFVLICVVLSINLGAKAVLSYSMNRNSGGSGVSWSDSIKAKIFPQKKEAGEVSAAKPAQRSLDGISASILPTSHTPEAGAPETFPQEEPISPACADVHEIPELIPLQQDTSFQESVPTAKEPANNKPANNHLRPLLPFAITAAVLLLIGFLATITPVNHVIAPAIPFIAMLFGAGLAVLVIVTGLVFILRGETPVPETAPQATIIAEKVSLWEKIRSGFPVLTMNTNKSVMHEKETEKAGSPAEINPLMIFLRTLISFSIPVALLLLLAFLALIPPFRHALGPASPSLAGLFSVGLALIIAVAGLGFGLVYAKKAGAFRGKTRRIGYAGVAAGICLLCIAGIVCASTASGLFNTGEQSGTSATVDKKAQLAALMAQMAEEEAASSQASAPTGAGSSPGNSGTVAAGGNNTIVTVPVKDALSLGELYQYGDSRHRVRATVYDYKILPYYFWWFIDYNRFVQSTPASGNSYLVVFVRVENTGDQSIVIPTADAFTVGYNGNTYTRLPYLNKSVISSQQAAALSSENKREQYYQWIREIGAGKRDYAYLTGQTYYADSWLDNSSINTTSSSNNTTSGNSTAYSWYYLKPGVSQAVDGYLIYEVPDSVATNLRTTYVNGGFNQISGTRWCLG